LLGGALAGTEAGRLVREGAIIVGSILLAFAIDAVWDELQDRSDEAEAIRALLVDFEANRIQALDVITVHESGHKEIARAVARSREETLALPTDSVAAAIAAMANPRTLDPVRATLDALLASGRFELLRDAELRRALTTFDNIVDDAVEDSNYLSASSEKVWDRMILHGGPWQASSPVTFSRCEDNAVAATCGLDVSEWSHFPIATGADLQSVLDDEMSMGFVRQYLVNSSHYTGEVRRQLTQIEVVLRRLRSQLYRRTASEETDS
jgi:hypothetical protein